MTEPACAGCGRNVRLKAASPHGPICSACAARRRQGLCASCGRHGQLVGRNDDNKPWCTRCYAAAGAIQLAESRKTTILAAVRTVEPLLPDATVLQVIDQSVGVRCLGQLARHLQAHPDALIVGPTSLPPVLDRFVRTLVAVGARQIRVVHPRCLGCGRAQPAHLRLEDGVLCGACHARRAGKQVCATCGQLRRRYTRDKTGDPRCGSCVQRGHRDAERDEFLEQLTSTLGAQTRVDASKIADVLGSIAPRCHQLRTLTGLLAAHQLTEPALPFMLSRLVIALRAAGADLPAPPCASCQQPAGPEVSFQGQRIRCRTCAERCPTCSKPRRSDDQRPCGRCRLDPHRRRGTCVECQREDRLLNDQDLCHRCRTLAARSCDHCQHNRPLSQIAGQNICQPCALRRTVDRLLPERPAGALHELRTAILTAKPMTTRRWLDRPAIAELLTDLNAARVPLEHRSLDAQPTSRSVEHLRDLLVASGALPKDPHRLLDLFEDGSEQMLLAVAVADARIVRSWLRWRVMPRLRRHLGGPVDIRGAIANAKRTQRQIIVFLTTLEATGRSLTSCEQAGVDRWFSSKDAGRHHIRPFLVWAQRTNHLPPTIALPPSYQPRGDVHTDPEQRWTIARRLVHDATLDTVDRVTGALVVLYAQPLVRICALTTNDVRSDGQDVAIRLGHELLKLHEPFATLIQSLPLRRRAGIAEQLPSNWLFPGYRAGRPLSTVHLGKRLRTIGIEPRRMRLAAIDQLSKEIPPAMLTGILGLKAPQTIRHTTQAGGDWANYAANRST